MSESFAELFEDGAGDNIVPHEGHSPQTIYCGRLLLNHSWLKTPPNVPSGANKVWDA